MRHQGRAVEGRLYGAPSVSELKMPSSQDFEALVARKSTFNFAVLQRNIESSVFSNGIFGIQPINGAAVSLRREAGGTQWAERLPFLCRSKPFPLSVRSVCDRMSEIPSTLNT